MDIQQYEDTDRNFVKNLQSLPEELQKKIFFLRLKKLKKDNISVIQSFLSENILLNQNKDFNYKRYVRFKYYGMECIELITCTHKDQVPISFYALKQFKIVLLHVMKDSNIKTCDLYHAIRATYSYNPGFKNPDIVSYNGKTINLDILFNKIIRKFPHTNSMVGYVTIKNNEMQSCLIS